MAALSIAETCDGDLRVRPRQPRVQRHQAGLGAEAGERQPEHQRARRRRQLRGAQRLEGLAASRGGEDDQSEQDRREPEMRHHGVPQPGAPDPRPQVMLGQDQHQRGERHQLPQHQQGRDAAGGRHQHQAGGQQRQDGGHRPTGPRLPGSCRPGVADTVAGGHCDHRPGHGQEQASQRVQCQVETGQRQQRRELGGESVADQRGHPGDRPGDPGYDRGDAESPSATAGALGQPRSRPLPPRRPHRPAQRR